MKSFASNRVEVKCTDGSFRPGGMLLRYDGERFWFVRIDGRELIVHEDDMRDPPHEVAGADPA